MLSSDDKSNTVYCLMFDIIGKVQLFKVIMPRNCVIVIGSSYFQFKC